MVDSEFPLSSNPNSWIISVSGVRTVLKSPWILVEVLEKSLNFSGSPWKVLEFWRKSLKSPWILAQVLKKSLHFSGSPWKVLEFSLNLNVVSWKEFSDAFLLSNSNNNNGIYIALIHRCSRQNVNHRSENLKVIYLKCFVLYNN